MCFCCSTAMYRWRWQCWQPVIVNILTFHALMAPSGLPLALFVAVLWAVIFIDVRPGLFRVVPVALAVAGLTAGDLTAAERN